MKYLKREGFLNERIGVLSEELGDMRMRAKYIMCGKVVHLGDDVIKELEVEERVSCVLHGRHSSPFAERDERHPLAPHKQSIRGVEACRAGVQDLLEYQRVITVRFYLLKEEKRERMRGNLRNLLEEAPKEVVRGEGDESK